MVRAHHDDDQSSHLSFMQFESCIDNMHSYHQSLIYENKQCGGLPFVDITIDNQSIPALLDSGSAFNMIRADQIKSSVHQIKPRSGSYVSGAG